MNVLSSVQIWDNYMIITQIENLFTATVINKFMRRHEDWLKQADSDLCAAEDSASSNHYEWACFQAQQAAEKALKALIISKGSESRIHSIKFLLSNLPENISVSDQIRNAARELDKHYIQTRYPDSFSTGIPKDFFTQDDAQRAISDAKKIIEFVLSLIHISEP